VREHVLGAIDDLRELGATEIRVESGGKHNMQRFIRQGEERQARARLRRPFASASHNSATVRETMRLSVS
jgi:hypothetical protein